MIKVSTEMSSVKRCYSQLRDLTPDHHLEHNGLRDAEWTHAGKFTRRFHCFALQLDAINLSRGNDLTEWILVNFIGNFRVEKRKKKGEISLVSISIPWNSLPFHPRNWFYFIINPAGGQGFLRGISKIASLI